MYCKIPESNSKQILTVVRPNQVWQKGILKLIRVRIDLMIYIFKDKLTNENSLVSARKPVNKGSLSPVGLTEFYFIIFDR